MDIPPTNTSSSVWMFKDGNVGVRQSIANNSESQFPIMHTLRNHTFESGNQIPEQANSEDGRLHRQINALPVCDLQEILEFAGAPRQGIHSQLIERCIHLMYQQPQILNYRQKVDQVFTYRYTTETGSVIWPLLPKPIILPSPPAIVPNSQQPKIEYRTYPQFHFEPLCFYDIYAQLTTPISLSPSCGCRLKAGIPFRSSLQFNLTLQQSQEISSTQHLNLSTNPVNEPSSFECFYDIIIRFCKVPSQMNRVSVIRPIEVQDSLPPNLQMVVNGHQIALPPVKPSCRPEGDILRVSKAIPITHLVKHAESWNVVDIAWTTPQRLEVGHSGQYAAGIYMLRKVDLKTMIDRVKLLPRIDPAVTRSMIINKTDPQSGEVVSDTLLVSLKCPLSKMIMTLPVRGCDCNHIQCFDYECYILMNQKRPTWMCPVCNERVLFNRLQIDGFLVAVLAQFNHLVANTVQSEERDCMHEVEFDRFANWRVVLPQQQAQSTSCALSNNQKRPDADECVVIDSGDEDHPSQAPIDQPVASQFFGQLQPTTTTVMNQIGQSPPPSSTSNHALKEDQSSKLTPTRRTRKPVKRRSRKLAKPPENQKKDQSIDVITLE